MDDIIKKNTYYSIDYINYINQYKSSDDSRKLRLDKIRKINLANNPSHTNTTTKPMHKSSRKN